MAKFIFATALVLCAIVMVSALPQPAGPAEAKEKDDLATANSYGFGYGGYGGWGGAWGGYGYPYGGYGGYGYPYGYAYGYPYASYGGLYGYPFYR